MIECVAESKLKPSQIWHAWSCAFAVSEKKIESGYRGKFQAENGKSSWYKVVNIEDGQSFTLLWKGCFTRLFFSHLVSSKGEGAQIRYSVEIRGMFAWPLRVLLRSKIERRLNEVLKEFVKRLERNE